MRTYTGGHLAYLATMNLIKEGLPTLALELHQLGALEVALDGAVRRAVAVNTVYTVL